MTLKVILADDRIVSINNTHGIEVGEPSHKPVDLNRLRYSLVQKRLLDLMDYNNFYVSWMNGVPTLHIEQLKSNWKPIHMKYKDRKKLINVGGKPQLKTNEVFEIEKQKELKYRIEVQARRKTEIQELKEEINKLKEISNASNSR